MGDCPAPLTLSTQCTAPTPLLSRAQIRTPPTCLLLHPWFLTPWGYIARPQRTGHRSSLRPLLPTAPRGNSPPRPQSTHPPCHYREQEAHPPTGRGGAPLSSPSPRDPKRLKGPLPRPSSVRQLALRPTSLGPPAVRRSSSPQLPHPPSHCKRHTNAVESGRSRRCAWSPGLLARLQAGAGAAATPLCARHRGWTSGT